MSLMWMPPSTTVPPLPTTLSASGTSSPTGAKTSAASSSSGGGECESPAQRAPSSSANDWAASSPGRVKANTSRPSCTATWQMMWAADPKP